MNNKKYYTITNDIVFKLSLKNQKEALFKLCTVFIKDLKDEVYNPDDLVIENPDFNHLEIKNSSLDIKFDIIDKYSFDLEMQKGRPRYLLEDRMLKYHAELIVRSYPKSSDYRHLICYSLWFIDFKHYEDDNPIHTLRWDSAKNRAGSITVVEIEKLKNYNDNVWYKLFTESDYSKLKGEDRIVDDLVKEIDSINDTDSLRYLMSEEYRGLVERNAQINGAREEGREEGRKEAILEVVSNLKNRGMTIEDIIDLTGLTKEEISKL